MLVHLVTGETGASTSSPSTSKLQIPADLAYFPPLKHIIVDQSVHISWDASMMAWFNAVGCGFLVTSNVVVDNHHQRGVWWHK
jgi:hypothetical protein